MIKNTTKYAILIPWVEMDSENALLFEVRSQFVKQPGEVCFPGGRAEPGESAVVAAVRETCEELGIGPGAIEVISELEPLIMGDGRTVHPVSARLYIKDIESLELSKDEVAEVFLLPAEWLDENPPSYYDLASTSDEELPEKLLGYLSHYGNYRKTGRTYYYEYDGHGIWGLTARIIKSFGKTGSGLIR
ncbi:MAG: CoA pyrophosphatase [Mogibacterium sp.]|nr:CoA pyrophosphatase [Mogibacterium sp.]